MPVLDQPTHPPPPYARLVPDLRWCAQCDTWSRTLTEGDARRLVEYLAATTGSVLRELQDMAWVFEAHTRALQGSCRCGDAIPERGYHLYRLWRHDRLLYVGVSMKLASRLRVHHRNWGDLITHVTYEAHTDKRAMLDAELDVIAAEHPAFNQAGIR